MPDRRVLSVLLLVFLLSGCERAVPLQRHQFYAFGTIVELSLYGVPAAKVPALLTMVQDDLTYMHETWHAWHPGALYRVNELMPLGSMFSLPPSVQPLISEAIALEQKSGGLFNPAIGELVSAWGFAQDEPPLGPPPDPAWIREYLADLPSLADLRVEGIRMQGENPRLQLNFGGFAKGYAVDRIIEHLREVGVDNAIINAGGDLRAIGSKGGEPWRIAIRHPAGEGLLASVTVRGDESVFTSGDYERFFEYDGKRYHHILDPRSGYPAIGSRSVTVIHADASVADAATTALFVAGPDAWPQVAAAMGVRQVMLVGADMSIQMTPEMAQRVHFETAQAPSVQVLELP